MITTFDYKSRLKHIRQIISDARKRKKNPYPGENKDLTNSFDFLYRAEDCELADVPAILDIHDYMFDMAEEIQGDWFDRHDYRMNDLKYFQYSYIVIGGIYTKDKVMCTYREKGYTNYKDYCTDIYGKSYSTIRKYEIASRVAVELMSAGFDYLPQNVDQAYALRFYTGIELIEIWEQILNDIPRHQIFASSILEAIGKEKPSSQSRELRFTLPLYAGNFVRELAAENNVSDSAVLLDMIRFVMYSLYSDRIPDPSPEDRERNWSDMSDLIGYYEEFLAKGGDDFLDTH